VDRVVEAAGDEVEVGAAQAEHQQGRGGDVGDRVGERHLGRDRLTGELGRDLLGWNHDDPLQPLRRIEAGGERGAIGIGATDHEAAVDRGRDIVRVTLQRGRPPQHLLFRQRQLEEVVGGEEPGDDRGGAGTEPTRQRNLTAQAEGDAVGRVQALEGADDEVVAPGRDVEPARVE
jgi:hypothetical protein